MRPFLIYLLCSVIDSGGSAKLKRTETAIIQYRDQIDARKAENYGFASMAAVPYAHIVANLLRNKHPKGTDIALAPNPKDIVRTRTPPPPLRCVIGIDLLRTSIVLDLGKYGQV